EFDLGDLEGLDTEPPTAERVVLSDLAEPVEATPQPTPAPEVAVGLEPGPGFPDQPAAEAVSEPAVDSLSLPEFGELEFEQEQEQEQEQELLSVIPEADEPLAEEVVPTEAPTETAPSPVEPIGGAEFEVEFAIDESVEESPTVAEVVSSTTAPAEQPEVFDEFADVEVIEELDEVEEFIENDEFFAAEAPDEVDELAVIEELDEVEPLEELDELDELDEIDEIEEEPEPIVEEILSGPSQKLRDDLEEAEFYLRQGLLDDAERVMQELQQRYAGLPEVTAMLVEIEAQRQTIAQTGEKGALFDLMADINDSELLGATAFLDDAAGGTTDEFSLEEAAEDDEDTQSHFDLGIAYKEMGLLDDAIAEFGKAVRDPSRQLDCLTLKGQCQIDMGDIDKAEATYKEGLALPNLTEEGMVALRYELGLLYETAGRPLEALESFQFVADRDLFYRDVTDKLKLLRQKLGIDDHAIEAVSEGGSGRDRISFV
ncbi:MAG: tetratricopeptide repeat protein, partial [Desulfuromonadales bacterium]